MQYHKDMICMKIEQKKDRKSNKYGDSVLFTAMLHKSCHWMWKYPKCKKGNR